MDDPGEIRPGDRLRIQEAERMGMPFVQFRGPGGDLRLLILGAEDERITVGRADACELQIEWDERVSRLHAVLERVGDDWVAADDGLSRNGTFVNGARISGQRRLAERDVLRVGHTSLLYRRPTPGAGARTAAVSHMLGADDITAAQRRVLHALARPSLEARELVAPATNEHIAQELHLTVEAVKAHLRLLYQRFGIEELPQVQKRIRLVQLAIEGGLAGDQPRPETDP